MKFILDFFVLINGISAASGIHYDNNKLFIVSDNSNYLYAYHLSSKKLDRHLLLDMAGQNEQVAKKDKMDLEAITLHKGMYYLFPSGSEENRSRLFEIKLGLALDISQKDGSAMYAGIRDHLNILPEDFNIEGALFYQDTLLLFNRGNGPGKVNGIIKVPRGNPMLASFMSIKLPGINGQAAGFTDATLAGDKIYFLATAESGNSSYFDGEIGGSQVGIINAVDLKLEQTQIISLKHKFEGITLYQSTEKAYTFLLCEDPDNNESKSTVYRLKIKK
jgi:hypothetical protein